MRTPTILAVFSLKVGSINISLSRLLSIYRQKQKHLWEINVRLTMINVIKTVQSTIIIFCGTITVRL